MTTHQDSESPDLSSSGFQISRRGLLKIGPVALGSLLMPMPSIGKRARHSYLENPVATENQKQGTRSWIVENFLEDIEGYAYPPTVNRGEAVNLYVNTTSSHFRLDIYRSGYYNGDGARLMRAIEAVEGKSQDLPHHQRDTGLYSCCNWKASYTLSIPQDWISGIYFAKLQRPDTGGENYILFVIRDDDRSADLLYQQSLFTYHAYNNYGGKSVYDFNSGFCNTVTENPRAAKVSMHRPYRGSMRLFSNANNNYFRVEYPMVRWLEAQGYDVNYSTNLDTHRSGKAGAHNRLLDHIAFLSVGHDEYWTQEMRDAVTAARDAGVHLGFFSANTCYWRIRLEDDPWSGEPESVIVTYKSTEAGIPDPSGHPTGTWRDPKGADDPETELIGVQYFGDNDELFFPMRVTAEKGKDRIYRHTDLQNLPDGTYANIGAEIFGWEWDATTDDGETPGDIDILAETPVCGLVLRDAGDSEQATTAKALAQTTRYIAQSGATVFASGTIQWAWGLGARGVEVVDPDNYIPQITYNILADMGVQPETPDEALILDGEAGMVASDDGAVLPINTPYPEISDIEVEAVSGGPLSYGRRVEIRWNANIEAIGHVYYGEAPIHTIEPSSVHNTFSNHLSVTLTNLVPSKTYYYRVICVSRAGQITLSDEMSFETPANLLVQAGISIMAAFRSVECWTHRNPTRAIGFGALGGIVSGLVSRQIWSKLITLVQRKST